MTDETKQQMENQKKPFTIIRFLGDIWRIDGDDAKLKYDKDKKTGEWISYDDKRSVAMDVVFMKNFSYEKEKLIEREYPVDKWLKDGICEIINAVVSPTSEEEILMPLHDGSGRKERASEEKVTTKNHKMFCFQCGAEIPKKIKRKTDKNNTTKGQCPSCERTVVFATHAELMETENKIAEPKKMRAIVEEEKERNKIIPGKVTASFNGKTVEMTGRIVAEKRKKGMPKTITWSCERCDNYCVKKIDITDKEPFIFRGKHSIIGIVAKMSEQAYRISGLACEKQQENKDWTPSWFGIVDEYVDYNILWMTDRLEDQADFKSSENKIKIILMGPEAPLSRTVRVCGKVVVDPFSNDLVVLADEIEEVETNTENLVLDEKTKADFVTYFKDKATKNLLQIAPDMVGHDVIRLSRLLLLHSPIWINDLNGKKIRGCLREVLFGDTKTYKSLSIKDIIDKYHFGEWCSAETGTRAGLLFYVDTEKSTISWGILPLNDRGYVGLESINIMRSEEFSKFREVLEDMRIKVTMSVQGASNVRTRMSVTMNPPKPMNAYMFPCQAIRDTYIFKNIPDITRWDIWLPFGLGDIPTDDIVDRGKKERPIPDDVFMNHIYWSWSISPENIIIEKGAKKAIKAMTKEIIEAYQMDILPIVHPATRDVITRLSVAMAILTHSTKDCITINVREKDVQDAVTFYVRTLNDLNLNYYKNLLLGEDNVDDNEINEINSEFEIEHYRILGHILVKPCGSPELAKVLNVSEKTIKRKYDALQNFGLIMTTRGKGITLTKKGILFMKKRLNLTNLGKTEKTAIRRVSDINVPMSLADLRPSIYNERKTLDSFLTNIDEDIDTDTLKTIKEIYYDTIRRIVHLVKDIKKEIVHSNDLKEYELFINFIKEKENEILEKGEEIKAILNKHGHRTARDIGTKVSPVTGVTQNTKKTDDATYLPKISKLMETKPKHVWSINDICWNIGIASLTERKKINAFLVKICSDPSNNTRIRMADESGLSFILEER